MIQAVWQAITVSTHSRPKAAGVYCASKPLILRVSTHSRPKAAGTVPKSRSALCKCFNTQPPEGGWQRIAPLMFLMASFNTQPPEGGWECSTQHHPPLSSFNTQPPEGGWLQKTDNTAGFRTVSTHSRPKAAGVRCGWGRSASIRFNTQPPEGGWRRCIRCPPSRVSFNTQPPEGGWGLSRLSARGLNVSTHSRPKAAGRLCLRYRSHISPFQHTAARRRLEFQDS